MFKVNKITFTHNVLYYIIFWQDAAKQGKAGKEELQILLIISYRLKKSDNSLEFQIFSLVHDSDNMKEGTKAGICFQHRQ